MFLATAVAGGSPSYYLVSGDNAVYLHDAESVQGFKKVGVPVVTFSTTALSALAAQLAPIVQRPWVGYIDDGVVPLVDGGAPNSVYYLDDFDGGIDTDISTTGVQSNFVPNPHLTVDTSGWSINQAVSGVRVATGGPDNGPFLRLNPSAAGNMTAVGAFYFNIPALPNKSYVASFWVRCNQPVQIRANLESLNSGSGLIRADNGSYVTLVANTWTRISITTTSAALTAGITPSAYATYATWALTDTLDVSMVQLERDTAAPTTYFDGDSVNTASVIYAWSGTRGSSISTATTTVTDGGPPIDGNHP